MTLDAIRASFIHELLCEAKLALIQLDYVLVAYKVLVLRLILWLLVPGFFFLVIGAIQVFLLSIPFQLIVTSDPGEGGGHIA